ncbi:MAG: PEP-CTERM sorting domain-containing protein [Chroococcales cyanobacterium]
MITNLTFTNRFSQTALISAGFALASVAFLAGPAQADTLTINLSDATNENTGDFPTVEIVLNETAPGTIEATVNVVPGPTGFIGDLRGVFLNLPGGASITPVGEGITAQTAGVTTTRGPNTSTSFPGIGNSALLEGTTESFNYGIEIGSQGISTHDYQTASFTISGAGLSLTDFTSSSFGVRMMSVGEPGGDRELSSKTTGTAPAEVTASNPGGDGGTGDGGTGDVGTGDGTGGGSTGGGDIGSTPDSVQVPEPLTMGGLILGAGGLIAARRRKMSQKG